MKYYCAFLLLCGIFSCGTANQFTTQDINFKKDHARVLATIDSMIMVDQSIRGNSINEQEFGEASNSRVNATPVFGIPENVTRQVLAAIDSIEVVRGNNRVHELYDLSTNNSIESFSAVSKISKDFTVKLIEFINLYGYPSSQRLKNYQGRAISPLLLLHHADWSYKDTLLSLLSKEYEHKRLLTNDFELLKWHLNGRNGLPNLTGVKITVIDRKTGDTLLKK